LFHYLRLAEGGGIATSTVVPAIIVRLTATETLESTGTYPEKPSLPKMLISSSKASLTSCGTSGLFRASAIVSAAARSLDVRERWWHLFDVGVED